MSNILLLGIGACIVAFIYIGYTVRKIIKADQGTDEMKFIAKAIQVGAMTFMKREFKIMTPIFLVIAAIIFIFSDQLEALFFLAGAALSAFSGYVGMRIATIANVRTTSAVRKNFSEGFDIAFSGGAVMGMTVVGLGLLGIIIVYLISSEITSLIGYAFGSSLTALFLRVGGGIYTKSADIGADLVGKVEAGIPEDDYRNPATIADNVGDNVGDIAGMGSDLFESYVSAIIAAAILGLAVIGQDGAFLPLALAGIGIIASLIGILLVRVSQKTTESSFETQTKKVRSAMTRGVLVSNVLMIVASFIFIREFVGNLDFFWALFSGMAAGFIIGKITEYYTAGDKPPTKSIIKASEAGPATNIIQGISVGMMSTLVPVLAVVFATLISFHFGGLFGIAIASVGILVVLGVNLSMDCYGPIADNAAGISEMAGLGKESRDRADALDSVGNTTAAIGKGFAISSAALAALAWVATFFHEANLTEVNLIGVEVISGIFIGAMMSFIFSALLMKSVGRGGMKVVEEVRKQFREIPGILEGKTKPDYAKCVDITTKEALNQMILPAAILIFTPLVLGFAIGIEAVGGLLVGALASGFLLAIFMSNSGGAWDNAKKYIESGHAGGKGSEIHKVAVIGDTVGDPFKDTSGPSLNILIKLVGKIAVVAIPLFLLIT